jgi:hypothetical protein
MGVYCDTKIEEKINSGARRGRGKGPTSGVRPRTEGERDQGCALSPAPAVIQSAAGPGPSSTSSFPFDCVHIRTKRHDTTRHDTTHATTRD